MKQITKERLETIASNPENAREAEIIEMATELIEAHKRAYAGHCCEASYSRAFTEWMP